MSNFKLCKNCFYSASVANDFRILFMYFRAYSYWQLFLFNNLRYEASADTEKEVILDENDDLWVEMRHQVQHIPKS